MTSHGITGPQTDQAPVTSWGTFEVTNLGTLWLAWTSQGLSQLSFQPLQTATASEAEVPSRFRDPLEHYFAGEQETFSEVPLDLHGTEFQMRVWKALQTLSLIHI